MKLSVKHTVILYYCVIFYVLMLFKWYNGMMLWQLQPIFIYNTFDALTWLFLQTGIPPWLLQSRQFLLFDALYYSAPCLFFAVAFYKPRWQTWAAIYLLLITWIYLQCYSLFPVSSVTIYIAGFLFPIVFLARDSNIFVLVFSGLRYFFLYFFVSAGVWKLLQGGAFNTVQMSAILLEQHKEMLTSSPHYWLSELYQWLVQNPPVSYTLYLGATAMELAFVVGFFTRKYDGVLILIYLVFVVADHLIMRIPYYETLPLLLTLYIQPVINRVATPAFFQKS